VPQKITAGGQVTRLVSVSGAVTATFVYDANGNMVTRAYGGTTYTLSYDAENRMTGMTGGSVNASFVYDGDGNRVKGTIGTATTIYIGNYLEWTGSTATMKKYYYAGGVRIAMRTGSNNPLWLLGDHLGSTSKVANFDGLSVQSQQLYKPWGEKRYPTGAPTLPTTFRYTGQRSETGLGPSGGEGLMFYGARWYDQALARFIQADTIVPGGVQGLDRYAYSYNNPVKYTDPTGFFSEDQIKTFLGFDKDAAWEEVLKLFKKGGKYEGRWGWLETLRKGEVGDQITIDWANGTTNNGEKLPNSFTFDLDANGNLILTGDGFYFDAGLAGLFGEKFTLSHYTNLSDLCSPGKCGYTSTFTTISIHEPYLHTKVKWGDMVTDLPGTIHVIEMGGITVFVGGLTVADAGLIGFACLGGPVACGGAVIGLGPGVPLGVTATIGLAYGTVGVFKELFIEITP
jgi:RHS repeat-associated protein